MTNPQENLIQDTTSPEKEGKGFGVEISTDESKKITDELSRINDLISHDGAIKVEDLENLSSVAKQTKIDVGGELMTVEEAEKIPDLKMNVEIWKEMSEGNFNNIHKLTQITPEVSKYLKNNKGGLYLNGLTSAKDLVLPQSVEGGLYLNGLTSVEGLVLPQSIGGSISLGSLIYSEGLVLPQSIGGYLSLNRLISAKDLVLPQFIEGDLYLNELTSIEGLVLPQTIEGKLFLRGLTLVEKEELREKYPQHSGKII